MLTPPSLTGIEKTFRYYSLLEGLIGFFSDKNWSFFVFLQQIVHCPALA